MLINFSKKVSILICFLITSTCLFAQKKHFVELTFNPLIVPVGQLALQEDAIGYVDFNYKEEVSPEIVLNIGRYIFNDKWRVGVGASYKKIRTTYDYQLRFPFSTDEILYEEDDGFINQEMFGLRSFVSYSISKKLLVKLIFELNDPINTERTARPDERAECWHPLFFFFDDNPEGQREIYAHGIKECIDPSGSPYDYPYGELDILWNVTKGLSANFGVRCGLSQRRNPNYELKITGGGNLREIVGTHTLNDIKIYRNLLAFHLGLSYELGF